MYTSCLKHNFSINDYFLLNGWLCDYVNLGLIITTQNFISKDIIFLVCDIIQNGDFHQAR